MMAILMAKPFNWPGWTKEEKYDKFQGPGLLRREESQVLFAQLK
jgi:hypothetical protein